MRHIEQRARPFGDDIRIKAARIHERRPMPESVDFRLQRRGLPLEHLYIGDDFLPVLDAKLATNGRKAKIALKAEQGDGEPEGAPDGWTFETGGHEQTGTERPQYG